jgi:hypothetical protein
MLQKLYNFFVTLLILLGTHGLQSYFLQTNLRFVQVGKPARILGMETSPNAQVQDNCWFTTPSLFS